jgi:hypothetical protein
MWDIEPFSEYSDNHINTNSNPDLGFYSIKGGSIKLLDSQMLFDPLEKQFNFPSIFV